MYYKCAPADDITESGAPLFFYSAMLRRHHHAENENFNWKLKLRCLRNKKRTVNVKPVLTYT